MNPVTVDKGPIYLPDLAQFHKPVANGPVFDLRSAFAQVVADVTMQARGYNTEGDVLTQTIDGRDLNEMWREFSDMLGFWNAARSTIVEALTFPVVEPIEEVPQGSGDDFERASEFGVPKSIRGGAFFQMAYDFEFYDLAIRFTWKYLAEARGSQVDSLANMALEADNRLTFSATLRAIFNKATRTADIRNQAYNVYAFYNGDATIPPKWKNTTHAGSHDHYLTTNHAASGAPSNLLASTDVDAMEEHLKHHGYGRQSGSTLVLMVNSVQLAVMRQWRVATGASYDFIPAAGQPPWLLPSNTGGVVIPQGAGIPSQVGGMQVAGRYGSWLVVEEDYIPIGYLFGFATGGANNATNPVGFREHQNSALRGLQLVKGREPDYPLIDSYYRRGFGTGVRHRGAGVVMQVVNSATYVIPTDYA